VAAPFRHDARMIRNACIHLNGEQPLLADLFELPSTADVSLRCTNLRNMNGKRPIFADDMASVFYFPMIHVRFLEVPPTAMAGGDSEMPMPIPVAASNQLEAGPAEDELDLEIDEDFLRRVREA
jgi:hypothetical protein